MFIQWLLVLLTVLLVIVDRWKPKKFVKLHEELGVSLKYIPLLGHSYKLIGDCESRMKGIKEIIWQGFDNKYGMASAWFGPQFFIISVADPKVANIFYKKALDRGYFQKIARHLVGNGTLVAPLEIWRLRRKILIQVFVPKNIDKFINVFTRNSDIMAHEMEAVMEQGNVSIRKYFCAYSLDSICENSFGESICLQKQPNHPFFKAFMEYLENAVSRALQIWLHSDTIYNLLPVSVRQEALKKNIYDFVDDLIIRKQAQIMEKLKTYSDEDKWEMRLDNTNTRSFLEILMEASGKDGDNGYSLAELREELLVLILAGTDTSSTAACFTCLLLSQYPEIQEKLYQEIQVFGESDDKITVEYLSKMKYLDAVLKESLRLYPPIPVIPRATTEDVEIPSGLTIPKYTNIVICPFATHRDPKYWGEDADEFKPERFLNIKPEQLNAFFPFAAGPRSCPGNRYSTLSIKTALVTLLRRYRFLPSTSFVYDKQHPLRVKFDLMMNHVDNYEIRVERRL